jgi:hypothetical protein
MAKISKKPAVLQNWSYSAEFEHGGAQGEVQAYTEKEAQDKVKGMYHGNAYDTIVDGEPIVKKTVVTKVTVTLVKE